MRIAFVIDQLDCGGAEQQLVTLCRGLRRRRHDVHVITIHDRTALRSELEDVQVPIVVAGKYGAYDVTAIWRLRGLIERIAPDIVHAYLPTASLMAPLCRWLGASAPVLQSERGLNEWRSPVRIAFENLVRTRVAQITCNADAIRRRLIAVERVAPGRISVIYNGVRADRRERPAALEIDAAALRIGAPPGAFTVVCVANFSAVKRHDVLLRAFAEARARTPDLFLVLVGRGELEPQVRRQVESLGLGPACRIITDCSNPRALLCAAHASILTSSLEGCSNALLEAMAMSLPVVAARTGGNPELIVDGAGGYVCPVGDVAAFATALVDLARRRETAVAMGDFNRRRVLDQFTDEAMVDAHAALYESVLGRHALPSRIAGAALASPHRADATMQSRD